MPCIEKAKTLGFCAGVRRAMKIAEKARLDFPNTRIFTFGELIHNREAINFLESLKVFALSKEEAISCEKKYQDAIIIVCAHGIGLDEKKRLEENFSLVIDGSCIHVVQNQKLCSEKSEFAKTIILVGEKNHQEILSLKTYATQNEKCQCYVVENQEEAINLSLTQSHLPICIMAQTTVNQEEYDLVVKSIKKKFYDLEKITVLETICPATKHRQESLKELASICDAIVVIGGKNSTNTKKLLQTALSLQKYSVLVENESELPSKLFTMKKIGITAGASTPDEVIERVINTLKMGNGFCS